MLVLPGTPSTLAEVRVRPPALLGPLDLEPAGLGPPFLSAYLGVLQISGTSDCSGRAKMRKELKKEGRPDGLAYAASAAVRDVACDHGADGGSGGSPVPAEPVGGKAFCCSLFLGHLTSHRRGYKQTVRFFSPTLRPCPDLMKLSAEVQSGRDLNTWQMFAPFIPIPPSESSVLMLEIHQIFHFIGLISLCGVIGRHHHQCLVKPLMIK